MHARQPFDDVGTREKNETKPRERVRAREKEEDIRDQIKTKRTSTLNLLGSTLNSCTRMLNPIKVAIEQCSTVGVKYTVARDFSSSTTIFSGDTTANCSSEYGCSGSLMSLMCAKISRASIGSLFEEEEEEPPAAAARSRSARFRREMEDEALFFVVDLTRGLALSNEDIISQEAFQTLGKMRHTSRGKMLSSSKTHNAMSAFVAVASSRKQQRSAAAAAAAAAPARKKSDGKRSATDFSARAKSGRKASCSGGSSSDSSGIEDDGCDATSRREHLARMVFLSASASSSSMLAFGKREAFAASSSSSSSEEEEEVKKDGKADDFSSELTEYEDASNNFHLSYPKRWSLEKKAGATALFKNPDVKYASIGVTVTPVRIDSLKEFGSLEDIGQKLVQAESQKQTTVPGGTFMERQSERESVDTKTTFYEYEYRLITTHGNKRVYNYVGVRDRTLFIVNAQAYEIEDGGEGEADLRTRALYREVGRSFDVLK